MLPTALAFLFPWLRLDPVDAAGVDLMAWSDRDYEWTADRLGGLLDVAKPVRRTVAEGTGDCEDYAFVAASWAIARGSERVGLAFLARRWTLHIVAYDEAQVYSSGTIEDATLAEWAEKNGYRTVLTRRVWGATDRAFYDTHERFT